jgi:hypothetical protein
LAACSATQTAQHQADNRNTWRSIMVMKKLLSTDDWLARHPKVMLAISVILFIVLCYMETI